MVGLDRGASARYLTPPSVAGGGDVDVAFALESQYFCCHMISMEPTLDGEAAISGASGICCCTTCACVTRGGQAPESSSPRELPGGSCSHILSAGYHFHALSPPVSTLMKSTVSSVSGVAATSTAPSTTHLLASLLAPLHLPFVALMLKK